MLDDGVNLRREVRTIVFGILRAISFAEVVNMSDVAHEVRNQY